jgi:hypothetical protein
MSLPYDIEIGDKLKKILQITMKHINNKSIVKIKYRS